MPPPVKNYTFNIFILFLLLNLFLTGGRIASSDETATYLLVESIVTRGALDVPPGIVSNGVMHGGKFYIWYEVGHAIAAIPHYVAGSAIASMLGLPAELRTLFMKAVMGTFNAFVGALYAALLFMTARRLGISLRFAFFVTAGVVIGSFALPYFKTFLREPLVSLYLLAICYSILRWSEDDTIRRWLFLAGLFSGLAIITRFGFIINIPLVAGFIVYLLIKRNRIWRRIMVSIVAYSIPLVLCGAVVFWYNNARFGDPMDMGYGTAGVSFTTPVYVGLFGLLLSPGKGLIFFAPPAILGIAGLVRMYRMRHPMTPLWIGIIIINLLFYSTFMAWGGDGSWGPRYLLLLLPFVILPAGFLLETGGAAVRRTAGVLMVTGTLIQLGGTTIYAGTYLREMGEFPYTRSFDDPEFLYRTHFIPNYSPIVGHWRMALRNIGRHLKGEIPELLPRKEEGLSRIPLGPGGIDALRHTLDYWFCYPLYAGYRSPLLAIAPSILLLLLAWQAVRVRTLINSPVL